MTQDEIDRIVRELEDIKHCCDCMHNFNGFCAYHGTITDGWNNCREFKRKGSEIHVRASCGAEANGQDAQAGAATRG